MKLKLLDLNILWGGAERLDKIIQYIRENNFDILTFQEVTGGILNEGKFNSFEKIKNELSIYGELVISWNIKEDKNSYVGNAVFFKKDIHLENKKIIWLKDYAEYNTQGSEYRNPAESPRSAISLLLEKEGKQFHIVTCHLAWGPTPEDKEYKLDQAKKLFNYLKEIDKPFILTGDFNLTPNSQIVSWFNTLGRNLSVENNIDNTLNPRLSRYKHLFPPGLPVDYIYVNKDIKVENFQVNDKDDLSDHLALTLEFEI